MDLGPRRASAGVDAKKKTVIAAERDAWARACFAVIRQDVNADDIVVVDEVGSNVDLSRRYARAPRGERAIAAIPRNTPPNTTAISSLTTAGMGPCLVLKGSVNTAVFEAYIEHVLGPTLRPGQIVVLDNLSAHKSPRLRTLLAERGCTLWYLPPYSPDYSPIELAFAKIKAALRRLEARTPEALDAALALLLTDISADEARAFFAHCGFRVPPNMDQWFCS